MAKNKKKKPAQKPAKEKPRTVSDPAPPLETPEPFKWRARRDWVMLAVVLAVALSLRLVFFFLNKSNNPVFYYPIMDALYHHEWAQQILSGTYHADDVYFRGPLYPYLLAFLYKISGSSIGFAVLFQHILGTFTSGLIYLLARELFSRRVALLAGLLAGLYWPFVYFEGDLLIVTTILFLNTLAFLLFFASVRKNNLPLLITSGIVLGLSSIARPSVLIVLPALPLALYLTRRPRSRGGLGWMGRTAVIFASILVVVAPVMIRNWVVGRSIVPIAASGGVNFYIGNNPFSDGSTAIVPGTRADWWGGYYDAIAIAERDEGRKLKLAEVSDYFFRRGAAWIEAHPGDAMSHFGKKLRIFWSGPERANNKFLYFFWALAGMKYVPLPGFWLIAPFALLGGVLQWHRRRKLSLLYLFIALYMIGVVAFFVNARFRLPVVPFLIIFAAYAVHYLIAVYNKKDFRLIKAIAVLAAAAVLVNVDYLTFNKIRSYSTAFSHATLGNAYMKMNRREKALEEYTRAWEIQESAPTQAYQLIARDVDYNLGLLLWEKGLCTRAIEVLRRVGSDPGQRDDVYAQNALDYLGDCYLKRSEVDKAYRTYQEFLRISPGDVRAITGLARCQAMMGNPEEAESMLSSAIQASTAIYAPAYLALGEIQRRMGKTAEAVASYTAVSQLPGYERDALVALAELYQEAGDIDSAIRVLQRAAVYYPPDDSTIRMWLARLQNMR